jgi:hypothetical protein
VLIRRHLCSHHDQALERRSTSTRLKASAVVREPVFFSDPKSIQIWEGDYIEAKGCERRSSAWQTWRAPVIRPATRSSDLDQPSSDLERMFAPIVAERPLLAQPSSPSADRGPGRIIEVGDG